MNAQGNLRLRWVVGLALVVFLAATTPLFAGLVGYWAMDEASWIGTEKVLDSSGKEHHGTAYNGAYATTDPERGTVGEFDGSNGYVNVPAHLDFDLGRNATISCWVKFDDLQLPATTHRIIGGSSYTKTFLLNQHGDRLLAYWGSTGGQQAGTPYGTLATGTWQHLAVTNDDGSLKVYVDGVVKGTGPQSTTPYNWNHPIYIGGPGSWTIDGRIDDVAIWTGALDPELIAGLAGGASPLSIPEPSTLVLAAFGLFGLGIATRRKRRR